MRNDKLITLFSALALCLSILAGCGGEQPHEVTVQSSKSSRMLGAVQATPTHEDLVQLLYLGYFGRPADFGGREWYAGLYRGANAPTNTAEFVKAYSSNPAIANLVDSFGTSQESRELYPGDTTTFVKAVYQNLFSRVAEPAGLAWWSNAIDKGYITRANAAITILAAAQGDDQVTVARKLEFAKSFYQALDTEERRSAYSGNSANAKVRAALVTVTAGSDPAGFPATIDQLMAELVAYKVFAVAYADGVTTAKHGKVIALELQGTSTPALQVVIDKTPVQHQVIDKRVIFSVPPIALGAHSVTVSDDGRSATVPLTVVETSLPYTPRTYVNVALDELSRQLAQSLARASGDDAATIRSAQQQIADFKADFSTQSEETARLTAEALDANNFLQLLGLGLPQQQAARSKLASAPDCDNLLGIHKVAVREAQASLLLLIASNAFPTLRPVAVGASLGLLLAHKYALMALLDTCVLAPANSLEAELDAEGNANAPSALGRRSSQSLATVLGFRHDRSRTIRSLVQPLDLPPAMATPVRAAMTPLTYNVMGLRATSSIFAVLIPQSVEDALTSFSTARRQNVSAHLYRLSSISDERIEGSYIPTGASAIVRFKFKPNIYPKQAVRFTFSLTNDKGDSSGTFSATLTIPPVPAITYWPDRYAFPIDVPVTETWQTGQVYPSNYTIRHPADRLRDAGMDPAKVLKAVDGRFDPYFTSVVHAPSPDGTISHRTAITAADGILTIEDIASSSTAPPAYYPNGAQSYSFSLVHTYTYNIVAGTYSVSTRGGQAVTAPDTSGNLYSNSSNFTGSASGKVAVEAIAD